MPRYIFKCSTNEAYAIKVLSELLSNNIKSGFFMVNNKGIFLKMFDNNMRTLVNLQLKSENFTYYKYKEKVNKQIYLGLNLNHFHKILKSVKKKDKLHLYILVDKPNQLYIRTIPKENTRVTTSVIKIQTVQNLDVELPKGYKRHVIVPSSEFQKMCKDLNSIGSAKIEVYSKDFEIDFSADSDGILTRKVTFGEHNNSDDSSDDSEQSGNIYKASFTNDQLLRITKVAGLSNSIQICPANDLPLLFKTNIGELGKLSIYIKSIEMVKKDENSSFNSDSDDSSDEE